MSDSKKNIPQKKRPQTGVPNQLNRLKTGMKQILNKTLPRKSKLPGIKQVQPPQRLSNTMGGMNKGSSNTKPALDEIEKEMESSPVEIKEMLEQASVEQRALTMIEDTLYLFNNKGEGKDAGIEKYELINKEEFEQMKQDIEFYRQKAVDLKTDYDKKYFPKYESLTANYFSDISMGKPILNQCQNEEFSLGYLKTKSEDIVNELKKDIKQSKHFNLFREPKRDSLVDILQGNKEIEKVTNELNNHNYKYYNTEKAKTDSITKLYSLELQLKQIIVNNSKLQNEIQKEVQGKNNIFRALNEFKRKYEKNIHPELKEIFSKIKDEQYDPINGVPKSDKIGFLEDKLESLKKELESKENRIKMLKKTIEKNNANN